VCQHAGGAAAIISNNDGGILTGTIPQGSQVQIPVLGMTQDDGVALLDSYQGQIVTLTPEDGYGYMSGTR